MATPPSRALGLGAGPSSGIPPPAGHVDKQSGGEDGRPVGLSSMDPSRRRLSGATATAGSFSKQKSPVTNDGAISKEGMISSSTFLGRASGSSRRAAISSSRELFIGVESDSNRARTTDASPGAVRKFSSGQRSSPVGSSDPRHTSSGRNTVHLKNYENALKGIEKLHFDGDERVHF